MTGTGARRMIAQWILSLVMLGALITVATPAAVTAQDAPVLQIGLNELNDSGIDGVADLTVSGKPVNISLKLTGAIVGGHPAGIYEGTCESLSAEPLYRLTEVNAEGQSETALEDVTTRQLVSAPHAIDIRLSTDKPDVRIACGDIVDETGVVRAEATIEEPPTPVGGQAAPLEAVATTGVGTAWKAADGLLLVAVVALALLSAGVSATLRVRYRR